MKPKPKKRETLHGWLDLLWNIDEYLLDTIVEAKQYYHAEIDIHFGKAISINQLKKKYGTGDEAGLRRMITDVMMKEIGHLSVINMNQLLAQYLIKGYAAKLRVYDMESLYDDLALLTQEIVQMGYYSKENGTQNTLLPSLEQALILFEQQFLIKKKKISGLEKYIIDKNSKEYFDVVPDPSDDEFKDKNFLYYTANQISHLPEVCSLIEATVIKRKKDTIL